MGAGHSIAVQNFSENIGILVMVGLYALMVRWGLAVNHAIVLFGFFVSGAMALVMLRHRLNQAKGDSLHLIGMDKPAGHGH
jgi:sugar phosphate permease